MRIVPFEDLPECDLIVDAIYEGSHDGKLGGEAISKLIPGAGNRGGFRMNGRGDNKRYALYR